MAEVLQSREFIGIANGGAAEGGNTVFFELQFEGDERVVFNCDHSLIAKLARQYQAVWRHGRQRPVKGGETCPRSQRSLFSRGSDPCRP